MGKAEQEEDGPRVCGCENFPVKMRWTDWPPSHSDGLNEGVSLIHFGLLSDTGAGLVKMLGFHIDTQSTSIVYSKGGWLQRHSSIHTHECDKHKSKQRLVARLPVLDIKETDCTGSGSRPQLPSRGAAGSTSEL